MSSALQWFVASFDEQSKFDSLKNRWLYSDSYKRQTPNSQFSHFTASLLQNEEALKMSKETIQDVTLKKLKEIVSTNLLDQKFSCVVSGSNMKNDFAKKLKLVTKTIPSMY